MVGTARLTDAPRWFEAIANPPAFHRLTPINDHGWYGGQCRFSGAGPDWGEFYEITGETADARDPTPWVQVAGHGTRHFHFYFRDDALEVKARDWSMTREEANV